MAEAIHQENLDCKVRQSRQNQPSHQQFHLKRENAYSAETNA